MAEPSVSQTQSSALSPQSSVLRSWAYLVGFSIRRHARVRQMVGIAVALLLLSTLVVALITANFGWDRTNRFPVRLQQEGIQLAAGTLAAPIFDGPDHLERFRRENAPLAQFSRWVVFFIFLGFLMPLWTLSFATSALGAERESRALVWLLTRPLPRSGIYVAKFLGVLPWCLALNLGGFALICLAGGSTGRQALALYWPAVAGGTLGFAAVFHLIGALAPRPAIVSLLYAFFFETILSELPVPGTLKRLSINYYTRCLMYGPAREAGVPTESDALFASVGEPTAWAVLIAATIALTAVGMWLFSRAEYRDDV
jgi:ABC-2 type transport system permease protein